jgi:hypothetical protein
MLPTALVPPPWIPSIIGLEFLMHPQNPSWNCIRERDEQMFKFHSNWICTQDKDRLTSDVLDAGLEL